MARALAGAALAVALVAAVLAAWAVVIGHRYLEDVQTLGEALRREPRAAPMLGPPPALDDEY